jgi:hypothetical protein
MGLVTGSRARLLGLAAAVALGGGAMGGGAMGGGMQNDAVEGVLRKGAVEFMLEDGTPVLRYLFGEVPEGERRPAVESTFYTHPLRTPSGQVMTDVAPDDHKHHRGVFLAWVQVEGERAGDWWGWGAKAPKDGRDLLNHSVLLPQTGEEAGAVQVVNAWRAEGTAVLEERLSIRPRRTVEGNVVDYVYRFAAPSAKPVTIAASPFGGFCYRGGPAGKLVAVGPQGEVSLPNSAHDRAETNWPASRWYGFTYLREDGGASGVAVIDHPENPPTTWHGVRSIHMLNPSITAAGPVTVTREKPLVLRYRVVAHDGPAQPAALERLAAEFSRVK